MFDPEREITIEEARDIANKFRQHYPQVAEALDDGIDEANTLYWRLHNAQLEAFEQWQEDYDGGDEEFAAIHVAWLLTRG